MNMVYKNKKLFIELIGEINEDRISLMKERLFQILDGVTINDIEINISDLFYLKNGLFDNFLDDFHNKYNGNIIINDIY